MGFDSPKFVDSEGGDRTGGGGGGGGGGGANATDWVDLSLDPTDPSWTLIKAGNSNNPDCTLTYDGTHMVASMPTTRTYNLGGTTNNGMSLISSVHIDPWANHASGGPPAGTPAQQVQPEAQLIKLEVQFDDVNGPWNAPGAGFGNGMICVAGFASWNTDQGGSPALPGWIYRGAQVRKNMAGDPALSTHWNMYRAGHKSYFSWSDVGGYTWTNMQYPSAYSHDAIVFELGIPLRKNGDTGVQLTPAGSYASQSPFLPIAMSGYGFSDGSTPTSDVTTNCNFFHFWLFFGSHITGSGTCKIKRIRYCIQPLPSRTDI